ncbi:hypothetical protein [Commensalibacter nepenthis]|uniref:Uncharacterized protein n=1 Tax=Commensalibacter nepenthis TaxID=3043872 RepID=A0ABT6QB79_9PROT|nr:hypothetical protein [Commensalibacter sp. TBRC 10068]MDI2113523.1 hypothetical protein [Commensalibacter sp. TBRC 10068]
MSLHLDRATDDDFFLSIIHNWNIIDYLVTRYKIWTGRIPLEALMVCTINYPFFWRTAIPLSLLLLSTSISKIVCEKVTLYYTFITLILLFAIPLFINANAAWWITGFYIYLLPLSLATYAISFIVNQTQTKIQFVLVCLTTFLFAYAEQIGVFFFLIVFTIFCSEKRTRKCKNFTIYILAIVNFIISITAPGNYIRLRAETWSWFPNYIEYSLIQKLCFGFDKLHQLFGFYWNVPLILFMFLIILLYIACGTKFFIGNVCLGTLILFISISVVRWNGLSFALFGKNFLNANMLHAEKWSSISTYVSYFFVMMVMISLIILILATLKNKHTILMVLGIFIVGIFDTVIIGFSPTIYASSLRIDYVFEVCCVMNCMFLIHNINQLNPRVHNKPN